MPYYNAGEMSQLGQRILQEAQKTIIHNNSGSIGGGYYSDSDIAQLNSEYGDVPQLFASYGQTDPANCQAAVDELFSVADNIDPTNSVTLDSKTLDSGKISGPLPKHTGGWTDSLPVAERGKDIDSHLSEWHGDARHQFDTFFVNHINTAFPLQAGLTKALALILQAHQEVRARANTDVWNIGQQTIAALQAHRSFCNCSPSTITATITVGTAAAAILTAGGAMAAALAVFTAANAVANAGIATGKDESVEASGGSTFDILAKMRGNVTNVEQKTNDQVSKLSSLTETLAENVRNVGDRIEVPSPNSAPGFKAAIQHPDNPGGFYPASS